MFVKKTLIFGKLTKLFQYLEKQNILVRLVTKSIFLD